MIPGYRLSAGQAPFSESGERPARNQDAPAILLEYFSLCLIGTLTCGGSIAADRDASTLVIVDEAGNFHAVSAHDFAALPRRTITAKVGQTDSKCKGVLLVELLQLAGVVFANDLRGKRAAIVIVLEATDGYRTAISQL